MRVDRDDESPRPGGLRESWLAVFRDVRALAVDLTVASTSIARQVPMPPIDQLATGWTRIEEAVLRELKTRLDELDAADEFRPRHAHLSAGRRPTPAQLLDELLGASLEADAAASREELYRSLLLRLVPDEARILAALADGTPYPLVHVQSRSHSGLTVLADASTVGRAAGVQVPEAVTRYVSHLRALGLADEGPADDGLSVQYDILLGEPAVRNAEEEAKSQGRLGAKVVRRTLRISALGRALWQACRPDELTDAGRADTAADAEPGADRGVAPASRSPAPGQGFSAGTAYRPSSNGSGPASRSESQPERRQGGTTAGSAGDPR